MVFCGRLTLSLLPGLANLVTECSLVCGFAYCFSASAMRGWFSLVKTDV